MNAQEAIEEMEQRLQHLKNKIKVFPKYHYRIEYSQIITEAKALAVVLESAKLLHEVLDAPTTEVIEEGFIKCFVKNSITVDKNKQRAIGIREEPVNDHID